MRNYHEMVMSMHEIQKYIVFQHRKSKDLLMPKTKEVFKHA
jgi:hypothetical protein